MVEFAGPFSTKFAKVPARSMQNAFVFVAAFMCLGAPAALVGQSGSGALQPTGHDYFNELRGANAFDHYGDEYVCFPDQDEGNFFIVARTADIEKMQAAAGGKSEAKSKWLGDDLLVEQPYYKGVASGTTLYEKVEKGSDEKWSVEFKAPLHGKKVYLINWITGRYRVQVFALDHSRTIPAYEGSGKCELIHPGSPPPR